MEMSEAENFLASFCDVVHPIKEPSAVYAHPAEKLQDTLVFSLSIRDGLDRKSGCKTDGFVMGNPVPKLIYMVQLIENVLVVNAEYRSGFGLGWKNGQQFLAGCSILRTGIHIFPYTELHLRHQFGWGVCSICLKTGVSLANYFQRSLRSGIIEDTARKATVAKPVIAQMRFQRPIYPVAQSHFKATDNFEQLT